MVVVRIVLEDVLFQLGAAQAELHIAISEEQDDGAPCHWPLGKLARKHDRDLDAGTAVVVTAWRVCRTGQLGNNCAAA
jgi:hypothetical protein